MNPEHPTSDHAGAGHAAGGHDHGGGHGEEDHIHPAPTNPLFKYVFSHDHKIIGIQFLFSGLLFFVLGGLLAMAVRWQQAWPWSNIPILHNLWAEQGHRLPPEQYNKLFTMHASVMIFFVVIPLLTGAFGNFLIPLMIVRTTWRFPG